MGEAEPASGPACFGRGDLAFEQALQNLGGGELVLQSAVELRTQVLGGSGEAKVAEVLPEALVGGRLAAHRAASS